MSLLLGFRPTLAAQLDLEPSVINLRSRGPAITAHIEIAGIDPSRIDVSSVRLAGSVAPLTDFVTSGDHDRHGKRDLTLRFDRNALDPLLTPGTNELDVTGRLLTGEPFQGSDSIRVRVPAR